MRFPQRLAAFLLSAGCLAHAVADTSTAPLDLDASLALGDARLRAASDEPDRRSTHLRVAAGALEEAIRRFPEDGRLASLLARTRLLQNHPAPALEAALRATALLPTAAEAHLSAGIAALRLDDAPRAVSELSAAIAANTRPPEAAEALRQRARALLATDDVAAATRDARRALELEPASEDSEALLRWCERRGGMRAVAEDRAEAGSAYVVVSEVGAEAARTAASAVSRLEREYATLVPLPAPASRRVPIHLLRPSTFATVAPAHARAFYNRDERAIFVVFEKPPEVERLVAHEAFHAHLHRAVEEPPAWLDEGLADTFAGSPHPVRLRDLQAFLERGEDVRFADLARCSRRELYEPRGLYLRFAEAWGWAHFLRTREPGRLSRYVAAVLNGASAPEAFEAGFGDLPDLVALESCFRDTMLSLRLPP